MFGDQISIVNCIFCIDQLLLILQKVIGDYFLTSEDNMEVVNILEISKDLLRVSNELNKYIQTSNYDERMIEINRTERIKRYRR